MILTPDFYNYMDEGIRIMTHDDFAEYLRRMKNGQSINLYLKTNKADRTVEYAISVRKEKWNDSVFYLIGGYGYYVLTINAGTENTEEDFIADVHHTLGCFDADSTVGVVTIPSRGIPAIRLLKRACRKIKKAYRYLLIYRNKAKGKKAFGENKEERAGSVYEPAQDENAGDAREYRKLAQRLSQTQDDVMKFITSFLRRNGKVSLNLTEEEEENNENFPVTSSLYGRHDCPLINITDVYLMDDVIYADGIDSDTGEKRREFYIYPEQYADVFNFIAHVAEVDMK